MNKLPSQILSILFVSSKPVSVSELAKVFEVDAEQIKQAVSELAKQNQDSGIVVLALNDKVQLASNPENSGIVKKYLSLELREKISDAAMETLAIVVYKQAVSKAEIENIRGVNSQYTIRQLLIRGLIEKIPSETDKRMQLYRPTLELMQHLGLKDVSELPDFEELTKHIQLPELGQTANMQTKPSQSPPTD